MEKEFNNVSLETADLVMEEVNEDSLFRRVTLD